MGEAVVSGPDRIAMFDALHRRRHATDAMLYAFDLLELDGVELGQRKARLARLLGRAPAGIPFNEYTAVQAYTMRLEGFRVEATDRALSVWAVTGLAEGQEPGHPPPCREPARGYSSVRSPYRCRISNLF
jgi:hypothetical protein